ncbi:MAG: division/cell wall cluster transcriptional repressor MraZ [Beijerinckiaceae bacterium]
MDRFVSQYTSRLDSKGRVAIPAPFRSLLDNDGYEGLYVHPALDFPALDCGGNALLGEIDALMARFPAYSEERDFFATALLGASQIVKRDTEGRFILTEMMRETTSITDAATFVGHGSKFQMWEPMRFKAHYEESRSRLRQMRKLLSPGASSVEPR